MNQPLQGVRILEVAAWTFVPAAGAVLADWGADVIKVEHPVQGDPQRGLITTGVVPSGADERSVNYMIEQPNRGKRSLALDISSAAGRDVLYRLARESDVFLTSFLPATRRKLGIDVEDIRAQNPSIIYARGSGLGPLGAEADKGGFDASAYWARSGIAHMLTPPDSEYPIRQTPALGDLAGGQTIAGGIAAALLQRERTGHASVVDISLLAVGVWALAPDIVASKLYGEGLVRRDPSRFKSPNPLAATYQTRDGRFIALTVLQSDRFWPQLCAHLGVPELEGDPRFASGALRAQNTAELTAQLDEVFASRDLSDWVERLQSFDAVWAPVQQPGELHDDPQVKANGYIVDVPSDDGDPIALVANPVQFDESAPALTRAPEHGANTEEILLELGVTWEEIGQFQEGGVIP